jgi:hypothetical protein
MPQSFLPEACLRRKGLCALAVRTKGLTLDPNCGDACPDASVAQGLDNGAGRAILLLGELGGSFPLRRIAEPARVDPPSRSELRQIRRSEGCKNRSKPAPDFGRKRQVISAESGT